MTHTVKVGGTEVPERRNGVVFSKDISLGNVLTMVAMLVSVVAGYGRLESRISILESADLAFSKSQEVNIAERNRQQNELRNDMRELRQDLKTLSTALLQAQVQSATAAAAVATANAKERHQ